jgi:hypothetical protein
VNGPASDGNTLLTAVSMTSGADAWAVGSGPHFRGLTEHWDGMTWTKVPNRSPGGPDTSSVLEAVSSVSPDDAWSVGVVDHDQESLFTTLIEHWDGDAWTKVPSPSPGTSDSQLLGVSALSATDAWAVGHYDSPTGYKTLILHWNGTAWTRVSSPNPGGPNGSDLAAVSAVSASDAWTVGTFTTATSFRPLTEHWNGSSWSTS